MSLEEKMYYHANIDGCDDCFTVVCVKDLKEALKEFKEKLVFEYNRLDLPIETFEGIMINLEEVFGEGLLK